MPSKTIKSVNCKTTIGAWIIIGIFTCIILAIAFAIWKHKMILDKLLNTGLNIITENKANIQYTIDDFSINSVKNLTQSPNVLAMLQPNSSTMIKLKSTLTNYILDSLDNDSEIMKKLDTTIKNTLVNSFIKPSSNTLTSFLNPESNVMKKLKSLSAEQKRNIAKNIGPTLANLFAR